MRIGLELESSISAGFVDWGRIGSAHREAASIRCRLEAKVGICVLVDIIRGKSPQVPYVQLEEGA